MKKNILTVICIFLVFPIVGNTADLLHALERAEQGNAEAQFELGQHTARYNEAAHWFQLAADQGHAGAQVHLSALYARGRGVSQDLVLAYAWGVLADRSGNSMARDHLVAILSPEQIAAGTRRAEQLAVGIRETKQIAAKAPKAKPRAGLPVDPSSQTDGDPWLEGPSKLARSTDHIWEGDHSYLWVVDSAGLDLSAPAGDHFKTKGSFELRLYNTEIFPGAELLVEFLDSSGDICKAFTYQLNFNAWRPVICKYSIMENLGGNTFSSIRLRASGVPKGHRIYLSHLDPASSSASWHSGASFQLPNSPILADKYFNSYRALTRLKPVAQVTPQDEADLKLIRQRLLESIHAGLPEAPQAPWKQFEKYGIQVGSNGIQGRGLNGKFGQYLKTLDQMAVYHAATQDPKAAEAVELGLRHFLDRGYGAGTHAHIGLAGYAFGNSFPRLLLLMEGTTDPALLKECWAAVAWHLNAGYMLTDNPPNNTDWFGTKSQVCLYYALFYYREPTMQLALLQAWHEYVDDYMQYRYGKGDHLKPDGSIYHHGNHYIGYGHTSMWRMILNFHLLRGTRFRMSEFSYERFTAVLRQQANHVADAELFPWTMNNRSGFPRSFWRVSVDEFKQLAEIGGDLKGRSFDPAIAAMSNRIYPQQPIFNVPAEASPSGFWQMNYANAGLFRRDQWLAFSRGFTDTHWGMEAGPNMNRRAYFQGHGSLEVLYPGSAAVNGYRPKEWDFNLFPGTTALRMPVERLEALTDTKGAPLSAVRQRNSFCGSVAFGESPADYFDIHGRYGLFAFDFESKRLAGFHYRKTHFFLNDRYIVCLLSGIGSDDSVNPVITTLFQRMNPEGAATGFVLNGTRVSNPQEALSNQPGQWLIDPLGTGFWVRNARVRHAAGSRAWAYIDHGTEPRNTNCEYVVVPAVDPAVMSQVATAFRAGNAYQILMHTNGCHAVQDPASKRVGMAVYDPTVTLPNTVVKHVDHPCLLVFREDGDRLQFALSNPNLSESGLKDESDYQIVTILLNGRWKFAAEPPAHTALRESGGMTELKIKTQYGKRAQFELIRE